MNFCPYNLSIYLSEQKHCTQWCQQWKPRGLDRESVTLIAPDRPGCTEIRQTRTDSSWMCVCVCVSMLKNCRAIVRGRRTRVSLYESESLYVDMKIMSRQTGDFFSSSSCNLHPAHQGKTEQMNTHTTDHHSSPPSQKGHSRDDCAPSTRQTLKMDKFLQEFRHDLWPDLGLTTAIIQLGTHHCSRGS